MTNIGYIFCVWVLIMIIISIYEKLSILYIRIKLANELIEKLQEEVDKLETIINNKN